MKNLLIRSLSAIVYAGLIFAALIYGELWVSLLFAIFAGIGLFEFYRLASNVKGHISVTVIDIIAGLVAFIHSPSGSSEAITSLIMSFGAVVAYIVGEGLADAAGAKADVLYMEEDKPPEEEQ